MGELTLFEALTSGAFDRLNWQHSGEFGVYLGVRTCELYFIAIVRVGDYYVDFFVFFVLRHW